MSMWLGYNEMKKEMEKQKEIIVIRSRNGSLEKNFQRFFTASSNPSRFESSFDEIILPAIST